MRPRNAQKMANNGSGVNFSLHGSSERLIRQAWQGGRPHWLVHLSMPSREKKRPLKKQAAHREQSIESKLAHLTSHLRPGEE